MNILILSTHLNPGGISRYILNLAKGLTQRAHRVWCASSCGTWLNKLDTHYRYIPMRTKSILSPKIFFSLLLIIPFIKKNKIEVVHANTRVSQCLAHLIYRFLGIPYVSTFHGFYQPSFFRRALKLAGIKTIAVSQAVQ